MVRESTVTQDRINATADIIKLEGSRPTARLVRERLGNTGSMGTILKYFQHWQSGQVKSEVPVLALPTALQKFMVEFLSKEVETAKEELQVEIMLIQQAQADLIIENEHQSLEIESFINEVELAHSEKAVLISQLEKCNIELTKLNIDATQERKESEALRTDSAVLKVKLVNAEVRVAAVSEDLVEAKKELVASKANAQRIGDNNELHIAEIDAQEKSIEQAKSEKALLLFQVEQFKSELAKVAEEALQERKGAELTRTEVAVLKARLNGSEERSVAAMRGLDKAKAEAVEARLLAKSAGEAAAELRGRLSAVSENKVN